MKETYLNVVENILGLSEEKTNEAEIFIEGLLEIYQLAKSNKEYEKVDQIRTYFKKAGLVIKDMKHGIDWAYEE
jgi:cysteinyl-tRNA synthetase